MSNISDGSTLQQDNMAKHYEVEIRFYWAVLINKLPTIADVGSKSQGGGKDNALLVHKQASSSNITTLCFKGRSEGYIPRFVNRRMSVGYLSDATLQ